MRGQVTIGHVTTLSRMLPAAQAVALESLARADIALVLLPATDLYLAGHGEPGMRSLAPLERARAAGVRVAIGNNNIQNPFAPFGNGNLLQAAWLAGIMQRVNGPGSAELLLDAISHEPAENLGFARARARGRRARRLGAARPHPLRSHRKLCSLRARDAQGRPPRAPDWRSPPRLNRAIRSIERLFGHYVR